MKKTTDYTRRRAAQARQTRACAASAESVRERIDTILQRLRTDTELHARLGGDDHRIFGLAGQLFSITYYAAVQHQLAQTPDAQALRAAFEDLLGADPDDLRSAVLRGLQALDGLRPKLHTWSLAAGALELDALGGCAK